MMDPITIRIPGRYMLWSPKAGPILGTFGLTSAEASNRLMDRVANGEAFPGERVRPMYAVVTVRADGSVGGSVSPLAVPNIPVIA